MAWRWVERAASYDVQTLAREARELDARRRAERQKRRDVAARLLSRLDGLLDSFVFEEAPAPITAAIERAAEFHAREFGSDADPDVQVEEAAALLPATAAAPTLTLIVNGEVRKFEVPAEGVVEEETDGV